MGALSDADMDEDEGEEAGEGEGDIAGVLVVSAAEGLVVAPAPVDVPEVPFASRALVPLLLQA